MEGKQAASPLELPQAKALLKDPTVLRTLLQSPQARQLIGLLQQQGDLNDAAKRARGGDTAALQDMLRRVGETQQGSQVLSQLEGKLPR